MTRITKMGIMMVACNYENGEVDDKLLTLKQTRQRTFHSLYLSRTCQWTRTRRTVTGSGGPLSILPARLGPSPGPPLSIRASVAGADSESDSGYISIYPKDIHISIGYPYIHISIYPWYLFETWGVLNKYHGFTME